MFKKNPSYNSADFSHNVEIPAVQVADYPENKLPDITVVSNFGDCLVVTSDVYDLFNQQRISNLGVDVVRDFIARNYPANSAISDTISRMPDDAIMASIKPRNIQSYSELMLWSKYLNQQIEQGLLELQPTETSATESSPNESSTQDSSTNS